jgi:hypothetical protein
MWDIFSKYFTIRLFYRGSVTMVKKLTAFIIVSVLILSFTAPASAQWEESLRLFGFQTPLNQMVTDYYNTEPAVVTTIAQNANITDDVITTFEIARLSNADPIAINNMRKMGMNWIDIMQELNVNPAQLYVDVGAYQVPQIYQRPYRELSDFRANPANEIMLYDTEVRHLANTRFLVQVFGLSPSFVMSNRAAGVQYTRMMSTQVQQMRRW